MKKEQALDIFRQIASQFRATPAEHETIKEAYSVLGALVDPHEIIPPKEDNQEPPCGLRKK